MEEYAVYRCHPEGDQWCSQFSSQEDAIEAVDGYVTQTDFEYIVVAVDPLNVDLDEVLFWDEFDIIYYSGEAQ